jgi:protein-arginine kinase activator protein McsA
MERRTSMAHTYEELHKMTAVQLRQIADGIEDERLKGHLTMHKEQLLPLLCRALGVEIPHHHVVGINKTGIKTKIHTLKSERDAAIREKDYKKLEAIRDEIHKLKRTLRKSMV